MSSLEVLEAFFSRVDSGEVLACRDGIFLRETREKVRAILEELLVWRRPELEASKGILWPYEGFRRRCGVFRRAASEGPDAFVRRQARLFLALLPFPGQWDWLFLAQKELADEPEIQKFLQEEAEKISQKIRDKPQRRFKLRHFCQILKEGRGGNEKGILRVFSLPYVWLNRELLSEVSRRYVFFVEPPMGVVYRHAWWRHFSRLRDPCVFGAAPEEDAGFLNGQPHTATVPLAHGDFLEDFDAEPPASEKIYDIVFNATYDDMPRKRQGLMLDLMGHPLLRQVKVLFLGRGEVSRVSAFKEEIRRRGLEDRAAVQANLRRGEIPRLLGQCRMGVHLSLYESACRSIYEFFRSDLPCVISSSMAGMNPDIFNAQTGRAVPDEELPEAIHRVLSRLGELSPRRWFKEHSGSARSSRRLNELFRDFYNDWGYDWREDIVPLGSSGASRYVSEADQEKFREGFEWLLERLETTGGRPGLFSVD